MKHKLQAWAKGLTSNVFMSQTERVGISASVCLHTVEFCYNITWYNEIFITTRPHHESITMKIIEKEYSHTSQMLTQTRKAR